MFDNIQRDFSDRFVKHRQKLSNQFNPLKVTGTLTRIVGLTLEATGCSASIGSYCEISSPVSQPIPAEVVGFSGDKLFLMPIGDTHGIEPNARICATHTDAEISVSENMLGRVIDGRGLPIDGRGAISVERKLSITGKLINPLSRTRIDTPLDVGIRSINGLLSVGRGQRLGLFAGSGVGKSVLLGMMTRFTQADVVVCGLIGERGRELNDFIGKNLGPEGLSRSVVVISPADDPPLLRYRGALIATTIAEYFRDQGKHVLLLLDSLTRFAQAQREISLAVGEPPTTKGYTPSVFTKLSQLVERAGNVEGNAGSITAFYTVLAEGDDTQDPIVDAARAILDGHLILTRELAEQGHYPAIDIEQSISRLMNDIVSEQHLKVAAWLRKLYTHYKKNIDLISVGAYAPGSDPQLDLAIKMMPAINNYLYQAVNEQVMMGDAVSGLENIIAKSDIQQSMMSI